MSHIDICGSWSTQFISMNLVGSAGKFCQVCSCESCQLLCHLYFTFASLIYQHPFPSQEQFLTLNFSPWCLARNPRSWNCKFLNEPLRNLPQTPSSNLYPKNIPPKKSWNCSCFSGASVREAPLVRKISNPSTWEKLVMMSRHESPSGRGRGITMSPALSGVLNFECCM